MQARDGPASNDPDPPVHARAPNEGSPEPEVPTEPALARSASPTPGDEPRPETETRSLEELTAAAQLRLAEAEALRAEIHQRRPPEVAPHVAAWEPGPERGPPEPSEPTAMERLLDLDRQRRMMRKWMDAEEAAEFAAEFDIQDARDDPTS